MAKNPAADKATRQTLLALRPERDDDREFLYRLYASTRAGEMALIDWPDENKEIFLRSQFKAQHSHYLAHYADSRFDVIEQAGIAIGRLYVARWPDEIRIIDITLLPQHRGRGLGGGLLRALLDEAAAAGKRVSIHVEIHNPAIRLYARLGFKPIGEDNGIRRQMEWRAGAPAIS